MFRRSPDKFQYSSLLFLALGIFLIWEWVRIYFFSAPEEIVAKGFFTKLSRNFSFGYLIAGLGVIVFSLGYVISYLKDKK